MHIEKIGWIVSNLVHNILIGLYQYNW
jgi:hypothetical protein